jgi:Ca2+-binding RTX toxin-like protein
VLVTATSAANAGAAPLTVSYGASTGTLSVSAAASDRTGTAPDPPETNNVSIRKTIFSTRGVQIEIHSSVDTLTISGTTRCRYPSLSDPRTVQCDAVDPTDGSEITALNVLLGDKDEELHFNGFGNVCGPVVTVPATVALGAGADMLFGGQGDKRVTTVNRDCTGGPINVNGGTGDDLLVGSKAKDTMDGGPGDDTVEASGGQDTMGGGDDVDLIDFRFFPVGVTAQIGAVTPAGGIGADVENLDGSAFGDHLIGSVEANELDCRSGEIEETLEGLGGDDKLFCGSAGATLEGQAGDDELFGGGDDQALRGGEDNDILDGGDGPDTFDGGPGNLDLADYSFASTAVRVELDGVANDGEAGEGDDVQGTIEHVRGGPFDDTLIGDDSDDVLSGRDGDDTLAGRGGGDSLLGGLGDDDNLDGGPGPDFFDGGDGDSDLADYSLATTAVNVKLDGQPFDGALGEGDDVQGTVEDIEGGPFGDTIVGNESPRNVLKGGGGSDTVEGVGGVDNIEGGPGDDDLDGGDDNDLLEGNENDDTLDGGPGEDLLEGGDGIDTVDYSSRLAAVSVDPEPLDPDTGEFQADDGEAGEFDGVIDDVERVLGGHGPDTLTGGPGAQTLAGGDGADTLSGGPNSDILEGGFGGDTLLSADGAADQDNCGPDADSVAADALDTINADCETITFPAPPVIPPAPLPPTAPSPSNQLTSAGAPNSLPNGTSRLTFNAPGPGQIQAGDAGSPLAASAAKGKALIKPVTVQVSTAGPVTITIRPSKAGKAKLKRKGKLRVRVRVTFTPTGGSPGSQIIPLLLKLK